MIIPRWSQFEQLLVLLSGDKASYVSIAQLQFVKSVHAIVFFVCLVMWRPWVADGGARRFMEKQVGVVPILRIHFI